MTDDQQPSIRLEPAADDAFSFRFFDQSTGVELYREEVASFYSRPQSIPRIFTRDFTGTALRLCGEGDSWINLLSDISGYPKTFFDILGKKYRTRNIGFPGDTLKQIVDEKQYKAPLKSGIYRVFIFSAGGNDVLGGGALSRMLKPKADGNGSPKPEDYIQADELRKSLTLIDKRYRKVAGEVKVWTPDALMLTHGYDYVIPRKNGKWLGKPLKGKGYEHDDPIARKITSHLVDRLNDILGEVARDNSHIRHVNLRGTVKTRWHDELHPQASASADIAKKFEREIGRLLTS